MRLSLLKGDDHLMLFPIALAHSDSSFVPHQIFLEDKTCVAADKHIDDWKMFRVKKKEAGAMIF